MAELPARTAEEKTPIAPGSWRRQVRRTELTGRRRRWRGCRQGGRPRAAPRRRALRKRAGRADAAGCRLGTAVRGEAAGRWCAIQRRRQFACTYFCEPSHLQGLTAGRHVGCVKHIRRWVQRRAPACRVSAEGGLSFSQVGMAPTSFAEGGLSVEDIVKGE